MQEEDYSKFKILKSNRVISKPHVQKLINSMEANPELFQFRPILVNQDMYIIDGQHRFKAAQKLGVPIWYVVAPDMTIKDTQAMNMNQRNWMPIDFARSYAALGNKNYQAYLQFRDDFPHFQHNILFSILTGVATMGGSGINGTKFKAGEFVITPEELKEAYRKAEMIQDVQEIAQPIRDTKGMSLYIAVLQMVKSEKYDHQIFLENLKKQVELRYRPNAKAYMHDLEDIYNWHKTTRVHFY